MHEWVKELMLNPNAKGQQIESNAKAHGKDNCKADFFNRDKEWHLKSMDT